MKDRELKEQAIYSRKDFSSKNSHRFYTISTSLLLHIDIFELAWWTAPKTYRSWIKNCTAWLRLQSKTGYKSLNITNNPKKRWVCFWSKKWRSLTPWMGRLTRSLSKLTCFSNWSENYTKKIVPKLLKRGMLLEPVFSKEIAPRLASTLIDTFWPICLARKLKSKLQKSECSKYIMKHY